MEQWEGEIIMEYANRQRNMIHQREQGEREDWCEKYLNGQPSEIQDFFKIEFIPKNGADLAKYDYMKSQIEKELASIEDHYGMLAQIGYGDVLDYIYHNPGRHGVDVQCEVLQNPNCPDDILRNALTNSDSHLRRAAAMNPLVPLDLCQAMVQKEKDPMVQAALMARLESIGKPMKMEQKLWEIREEAAQRMKKRPSLNDQIKAAGEKREEQLSGMSNVRESIVPER